MNKNPYAFDIETSVFASLSSCVYYYHGLCVVYVRRKIGNIVYCRESRARKREPRHTLEKFLSVVRVRAKHSLFAMISVWCCLCLCFRFCHPLLVLSLYVYIYIWNIETESPSSIHPKYMHMRSPSIYHHITPNTSCTRYIDSCYPPHTIHSVHIHYT